jgi:hypothetical protein
LEKQTVRNIIPLNPQLINNSNKRRSSKEKTDKFNKIISKPSGVDFPNKPVIFQDNDELVKSQKQERQSKKFKASRISWNEAYLCTPQ